MLCLCNSVLATLPCSLCAVSVNTVMCIYQLLFLIKGTVPAMSQLATSFVNVDL